MGGTYDHKIRLGLGLQGSMGAAMQVSLLERRHRVLNNRALVCGWGTCLALINCSCDMDFFGEDMMVKNLPKAKPLSASIAWS